MILPQLYIYLSKFPIHLGIYHQKVGMSETSGDNDSFICKCYVVTYTTDFV